MKGSAVFFFLGLFLIFSTMIWMFYNDRIPDCNSEEAEWLGNICIVGLIFMFFSVVVSYMALNRN